MVFKESKGSRALNPIKSLPKTFSCTVVISPLYFSVYYNWSIQWRCRSICTTEEINSYIKIKKHGNHCLIFITIHEIYIYRIFKNSLEIRHNCIKYKPFCDFFKKICYVHRFPVSDKNKKNTIHVYQHYSPHVTTVNFEEALATSNSEFVIITVF